MRDRLPLQLDATGQYIGGTLVGPHDNRLATPRLVKRHMAELHRVSGH